jgi:hypothetical protein
MHRLAALGLLFGFLAVPSADLLAQKDKKKMDAPPAIDSAKLTGEFIGTLKSTPGTDRLFIVSVETKKLVPTGKKTTPYRGNNANVNRIIQLQNRIAQDQSRLQSAKNPQQVRQYYQNLIRDQQQLQAAIIQLSNNLTLSGGIPPGYKIDTTKQDVEFQASETVQVRTMVLPEQFDDKGNVKKYTKEELAELKGKDKKAVGYESSLEKLEPGMKVRVVLAPAPKKKDEAKQEKDKAAKDKEDKDKDELNPDKKMQVKQLVILEDAPAAPAPKKGKK